MTWWALAAACSVSRDPEGGERQMALRADDLDPVSIKPAGGDRRAEDWSVSRSYDGWTLRYDYDHAGLSISYEASLSSSEAAARRSWGTTGLAGSAIARMQGVELVEGEPVSWGDEAECRYVQVSGHDIGFRCRGRNGKRTYAVAVYGVSPHGPGDPERLLRAPLAALDRWDPTD
jgi:hypothetical protein